jgi:hypothetical protein
MAGGDLAARDFFGVPGSHCHIGPLRWIH